MKKLIELFAKAYGWLNCGASVLQSPILLIMRVYWGLSFFQTGKGKLMDLSKPTEYFQSLGIPFPHQQAILAGCTECVGGLLLAAGLASRLVSIPLTVVMIVAYLTAENEALKAIFNNTDKFTSATPFLFLLTVLIVLAFGPGAFSLDWVVAKIYGKKKGE
jgi:putative oxidoreductase